MNKEFDNTLNPEVKCDFDIRDGALEDLASMALVTARASAKRRVGILPDSLQSDSEDYSELRERSNFNGFWSVLAFDGEKLAGFAAGYPGTWKGEDDGQNSEYLYLLMVDPNYQRQGLGRILLNNISKKVAEIGRDALVLWVNQDNDVARRFYESEGFVQTETSVSKRHGEMVRYQLDLK